MNPFTRYPNPATPREHQSNANYWTYERMGAQATLAEYDRAKVQAPCSVISEAHTARWVEREHIRIARQARAKLNATE